MAVDDRGDSFLTVAEVADWLKLNQQTVRNWIDQGSLPAVRVGRRVRIKRADLERILDRGYQGGSPPPVPVSGPSADDFWSGEPVGAAEFDPAADAAVAERIGTGLAADAAVAERIGTGLAADPAVAEPIGTGPVADETEGR